MPPCWLIRLVISGSLIEWEEIESGQISHESVKEAVVFVREDGKTDEYHVSTVVLSQGEDI
jgi:acyl-coenzyme A synthetase/AMP-(fatty) acid ligase